MLIGQPCDAQFICFRAMGNACPIDMDRDVRVTDFFEGRIETSMLGTDLNVSLKFIARMSVVDGEHVASLQVRSQVVDPIERNFEMIPVSAIGALAKSEMARLFDSANLRRIPGRVLGQIGERRARTDHRAHPAQQ